MNKLVLALSVATLSFLTACGGSPSSSSTSGNNNVAPVVTMATGYFVDSPVQGLTATSGSTVSVTDSSGKFDYEEGKPVTFSLGGIVLGTATGGLVMTPTNLDSDTTDVASARTTNVLRFLQTLDADGDPSNGITLSDTVRQAAASLQVDFSAAPDAFEADSRTQYAVSVLGQLANGASTLVPAEQARAHYRASMNGMLSGEYRVSFGTTGSADIQVLDGQVSSVSGTTPNGVTMSTGHIATDGTLVFACSGTDCLSLTVTHTDGSSALGSWTDLTGSAQGQFTAEHFVRTPRLPICMQMPSACK